jgi:hypothetical protein
MVDKPASPWYYAGATGGIVDTTAVDITPAGVAGQRYFLSNLQYANTGTASEIVIQSKAGPTIIWRGYAPAGGVETWIEFDPPLQSPANDALQVKMVTTASATRVSAQGFIDP